MRRSRWVITLLVGGVLLFDFAMHAPSHAMADEPTEQSNDQPDVGITLPEVIVTAERAEAFRSESRTAVTSDAAAVPAPTTILDSNDIRRTPIVNSYVDLFRPLPGFNVNNFGQGGIGKWDRHPRLYGPRARPGRGVFY